MKNKEIIEGNEIIARFNGDRFDTEFDTGFELDYYIIEDSRYHLEWNWIMPVYIKIVRLMDKYAEMSEDCVIRFNVLYDRVGDGDGILEIWEQVIEWIKCYNKSQEDISDEDIKLKTPTDFSKMSFDQLKHHNIMVIKYVKIREVYDEINSDGLIFGKFNTRKFRRDFKILLKKRLMEHGVTDFDIKCDEENNSPEIVEKFCLVARVSWVNENKEIYYSDLIFGDHPLFSAY